MKKKNKIYIEATELYENGEIDKALKKCEQGISENMKNASILNLKGLLLYLKGDLQGAITTWKINSDFNDDVTSRNYIRDVKADEARLALYKSGEKLLREAHIEESIIQLNKCMESDFNSIRVNGLLALCYLKKGEYDLASIHVTKVLEIDKNNQTAIKIAKDLEEYAGIKLTAINNKGHIKIIFGILGIIIILTVGFFTYNYFINNKQTTEDNSVVIEQSSNEPKQENIEEKKNKNENEQKGQNTSENVNIDDIQKAMDNKDYEGLIELVTKAKDKQLSGKEKTIFYNAKELLNTIGVQDIYNKGLGAFEAKKYDEGIKEFTRIYNYDKNNYYYPHSIFYLGLSSEYSNKIDDAIKYYDEYYKSYGDGAYASGAVYSLMLIYKNIDIDKSINYAKILSQKYSDSMYNNEEVYALLNNK